MSATYDFYKPIPNDLRPTFVKFFVSCNELRQTYGLPLDLMFKKFQQLCPNWPGDYVMFKEIVKAHEKMHKTTVDEALRDVEILAAKAKEGMLRFERALEGSGMLYEP